MLATLLLLASSAHAVFYNVRFCAMYGVDYEDADFDVGDDYMRTNNDVPARGAIIRIQRTSDNYDVWFDYTDWDGSYLGCTPVLLLNSNADYRVAVHSRALVNGNIINVLNNDSDDSVYGYVEYGAYSPTSSTTVYFDTPLGAHWNIAAAAGWGILRRAVGLSGQTFTFYTQECPTGGSCRSGNAVYIDPPADRKYVINHEFGHLLAYRRDESLKPESSYAAEPHNCYTNYDKRYTSHEAASKEYQSAAATEGYAHYYAAVSFNETDDPSCGFAYYKSTNWDLTGPTDDLWVSCDLEPFPGVGAGDYLGNWCDTPWTNRGTEWDWLRFLWDLDSDSGVSTTTIFDIYDRANPHSWTAAGDGTGSNYPATRLRDAADAEGVLTEWDTWDYYNGVQR